MLDELSPSGLSLQTLSPTLEVARAKRDLVYGRASAGLYDLDNAEQIPGAETVVRPDGKEEYDGQ